MKALVRVFPGQRIYVPCASPDHVARFRENFGPLIGSTAVEALIEELGGTRITIPTHRNPPGGPRRNPVSVERVAQLTLAKKSAQEIAAELQCEPRTVHKARTKARELGLFNPRKRKVRA